MAGLEQFFPMTSSSPKTELPSARTNARRVWSVDLLDGTKEFIDHLEMYVVMIGLAIDGEAVLVVYQPNQDGSVSGAEWRTMTKNGADLPIKLSM